MNAVAIHSVGLVTSIGLDAATTCAALRASVTNPSLTRFRGSDSEWIGGHQVELDVPWVGVSKLAHMAAQAAAECLAGDPDGQIEEDLPVLLCVAEHERHGRLDGLDERLFDALRTALRIQFDAQHSAIVPLGRVAALAALENARRLIVQGQCARVLVVAADSLLSWPTLRHYRDGGRLLARKNSNGFIPGEGAGAMLIGKSRRMNSVQCVGVGSGREPAPLLSGEPLRGDGLTMAIRGAMQQAELSVDEIDFIVADLSGEQYFFKEASLARARALRGHRRQLELWHPAEGIGEAGALAGIAGVAAAWMAMRKGYVCGPRALVHGSDDASRRYAAVLYQAQVGK